MRKSLAISAIIGMMVAGAATAALAKPGDQYTLFAGGCLPGDTVNPAGSSFHCTENLSANPNGKIVANKAAIKASSVSAGSQSGQPAPVKASPAIKAAPAK